MALVIESTTTSEKIDVLYVEFLVPINCLALFVHAAAVVPSKFMNVALRLFSIGDRERVLEEMNSHGPNIVTKLESQTVAKGIIGRCCPFWQVFYIVQC